jgi:leukotriene-A4 hydrolase
VPCTAVLQYLRPLYRALWRSGPQGKQLALDTFAKVGDKYHPIARKMVETDLQLRTAAQ